MLDIIKFQMWKAVALCFQCSQVKYNEYAEYVSCITIHSLSEQVQLSILTRAKILYSHRRIHLHVQCSGVAFGVLY